jgi:hypothetical protein
LPQIHSTNHDIVSKKSILLLVPFVVIDGVPSLKNAVNDIFSQDETSGSQKDMMPSSQLASSYLNSTGQVRDDVKVED